LTRHTFVVKSGARDDDEGRRIALSLDLTGVCERVAVPALYVTGAKDGLIPWQQTQVTRALLVSNNLQIR
jgi:hypothetical protein